MIEAEWWDSDDMEELADAVAGDVGFIIEKTGRVDSVWVQRSAHALLDAEAMRVVDAMPDWSPGTQDGKPVRVQYVLPISFTMDPAQLEKIRKKAAKRKAREKP